MIAARSAIRCVLFAVGMAGTTVSVVQAQGQPQPGQSVPNALQGFGANQDKPVQIKAQTVEVRDKERKATFSGNVQVVQGDATIRCRTLVVSYVTDGGTNPAVGARIAQPGPGGKSQISKIEALGGVIVTQKDQTATGEAGVFDMNTKIITLTGNVVISQGGNVMRGDRMIVDLNNGVSRIESKKEPVRMLIPQGQPDSSKPGLPIPPSRLDVLRPGQSN